MSAGRLYRALASEGIPMVSVSIGSLEDKQTWKIELGAAATPEQREVALRLVHDFDPNAPSVIARERDAKVTAELSQPLVQALLLWVLRRELQREPKPSELADELAALTQARKDVG